MIEDAEHNDLFSPSFREDLMKLPKEKNYYVDCRSGNRSGKAVRLLTGEGYTAYNLAGGIMRWPY
jgi:rhodanese-related sulfurtransferase